MVSSLSSAILDTNIIIYVLLADIKENLFNHKKDLCIADKVQDELDNKFSKSKEYANYCSFANDSRIRMIYEKEFDMKTLKAMEVTLAQCGMKSCFGRKARKKNEGEMISALYAYYKGIPILYTHDLNFIREYKSKPIFSSIRMINFHELLQEIFPINDVNKIKKKMKSKNYEMEETLAEEHKKRKIDNDKIRVEKFMKRFNLV